MKRFPFLVLIFGLVPQLAAAHDYWLQPSTFFPKTNQTITVRLLVGDHFQRESERTFQKKIITRCQLYSAGSVRDLFKLAKENAKPFLRLHLAKKGTHLLVVERNARLITLSADKFNRYLKHEGLDEILRERKKSGELNKPGKEKYSRYLKCLLHAGGTSDPVWKKRVKQKLEIVLLSNPIQSKPGNKLRVRILFAGKPLPRAAFFAYHKSGQKVHTQTLRTDKRGAGAVTLPRAGMYIVRLVHMHRCKTDPAADWESYWAALTFQVRAKPK